jgi:EAL domain-containing protein (putative c-di-GMP-specific phosphodiesterase class I)/ActR/RegA family two-component response regulator
VQSLEKGNATTILKNTDTINEFTVLIVDDSMIDLVIVVSQVRLMGVKTMISQSGEGAIKLFSQYRPDLILMDLNMPGMGGAKAIKELRRVIKDDFVPIILVSGLINDADLLEGLLSGADDFVQKPITYPFLKEKIFSFLNRINDLPNESAGLQSLTTGLGLHAVLREFSELLEFHQFTLVYQPVVDLRTGRIIQIEALLRWDHPVIGAVPPSYFIPVAEQTGRMGELTRHVLESAAEFIKELKGSGFALPLSINMSYSELMSDNSVEKIAQTVRDMGIDNTSLIFEISETCLLRKSKKFAQILKSLRALGFRLTIDSAGVKSVKLDIGSLFNTAKIDKRLLNCSDNKAAQSARDLIKSFSEKEVLGVCKGIETPQDASHAQEAGCFYGQGMFFSKPLRSDEMLTLLKSDALRIG